MDARIIKQSDIYPQQTTMSEWNHITFTDNDVLNWKCFFISFLFLESNKKT